MLAPPRLLLELPAEDLAVAQWAEAQVQRAAPSIRRKQLIARISEIEARLISRHRGETSVAWSQEQFRREPSDPNFRLRKRTRLAIMLRDILVGAGNLGALVIAGRALPSIDRHEGRRPALSWDRQPNEHGLVNGNSLRGHRGLDGSERDPVTTSHSLKLACVSHRGLGIAKPSLYAAFGNKAQTFRKAVARYAEVDMAYVSDALSRPTAREVAEQPAQQCRSDHKPRTPPGMPLNRGRVVSCAGRRCCRAVSRREQGRRGTQIRRTLP